MSSDGYFDGDDLDVAAYEELDAIEAAAFEPQPSAPIPKQSTSCELVSVANDDSFYDLTLELEESELRELDDIVRDAYDGKSRPLAGPSRSKSATHQTTLFGDILPPSSSSSTKSQMQRSKSAPRNPFGQRASATKVWDHTAFAKTGLKPRKSKGKTKATYDDEQEDEEVEFEQFPAPFVSGYWVSLLSPLTYTPLYVLCSALGLTSPPPPMKLTPDLLEAKHWIYPLNRPKRDYQFNIVKRCLFENTIVALPTGLGKTFIAGVLMLNYYRWFPDGKVVFVAPTKPLVAQQIDACHQTCGIPGSDAAELTGHIPKPTRGRLWKEKRVFYMTPQTLVNDLTSENCDVRDIILLVIDEAHRATGGYAYNQVVRFLMAKNPHFRILALTATPGGNPEAVQNLIDGLHISHIEIRDENSLDLKPYIHKKTIEQHVITMTEDVNKVKDLLSALIDKDLKPLRQRGIVFGHPDPVRFHSYSAQSRLGQLTREQQWAFTPLTRLATLARAMGYLIEGTLGMCYTYLRDISQLEAESGPGKATGVSMKKALRNDSKFQAVLNELNSQKNSGFSAHPKMDCLKTLTIQHFAQELPENEGGGSPDETRVMVFVTFREAVDEIVEMLNSERPLIRAHKFIGQGLDKLGKKGLAQKEQLDIIKRFKAGEFNVLVATSIGEEGLDIGEVDLIVCYDAQKTPIRMLQRLGRTGRKRAGVVHVLLAEGREELNLDKAKDTYKEVQKTILRGEQLELYSDVPRLLPEHIKPQCLEKPMEIQEYVRVDERKPTKVPRSLTAGTKRKRNDDISRNIPTGASTGFVSVADLLVKDGRKRKAAPLKIKDFDLAGEDDDTDREIEAGLVSAPSDDKRAKKPTLSKKLDRSQKIKSKTVRTRKKTTETEPTPVMSCDKRINGGIDTEIERGLIGSPVSEPSIPSRKSDSPPTCILESPEPSNDHASPERREQEYGNSMAWLVDEDEDPEFEIVDSPPVMDWTKRARAEESWSDRSSTARHPYKDISSPSPPASQHKLEADQTIEFVGSPRVFHTAHATNDIVNISSSPRLSETGSQQSKVSITTSPVRQIQLPSSPLWPASGATSPVSSFKNRKRGGSSSVMPPPILAKRAGPRSLGTKEASPQPSFPVRRLLRTDRQPFFDSSSPDPSIPSYRRRLHRRASLEKKEKAARPPIDVHSNPLFDFEAVHSGDEVSEGMSDPEDEEDESDRAFVQELPETQVSPSYDQTLAYRQSLFTQVPAGAKAPAFANGPVRRGNFGVTLEPRHRRAISSSPPREEPDEYAIGSFVVDDEADISYDE